MEVKGNIQSKLSNSRNDFIRSNLQNSASPISLKEFKQSIQRILSNIQSFQASNSGGGGFTPSQPSAPSSAKPPVTSDGPGKAVVVGAADGDRQDVSRTINANLAGTGQAAPATPEAGDGLRFSNGAAPNGTVTATGTIVNNAELTSESNQGPVAGLRFTNGTGFEGTLVNNNLISGANNGLYFGNSKNDANVINNGTISSDSRAVNLDGTGIDFTNNGSVIGTGNQRDGTIYSDSVADDFSITNNGLVDAGKGNEGAGISLQNGSFDGDVVNANIVNNGTIAGRGQAGAATPGAGDGIRVANSGADGGTTVFQGDIVNNGDISSESNQGPTAGIRFTNGAALDGTVTNNGSLSGANNGLYFGDTENPNANAVNNGTISSDSRAVNIDGTNVNLTNNGQILGTGNQRDGTIYTDATADDFSIINNGLVDAGKGNEGSGISLQNGSFDGDVVNGSIVNNGLVQGRGQAGAATPGAGDGIRVANSGADGGTTVFQGDIVNNGTLASESNQGPTAGLRFTNGAALDGTVTNNGTISGANNGLYFGDTENPNANAVNNGTISSDSRAVNIDGTNVNLTNNGQILGTGDQRDGTIYTDATADDFSITNNGLVDAGAGNEGAGISLQNGSFDGDVVNGSIVNNGLVQGRGQAGAATPGAGDGIRVANSGADGGTTVFQGDIVNNGTLASESNQGPTAGLRFTNGAALDGTVTNNGTISGANNGLYFGDTENPNANAVNNGTISSDSRAVNVDGTNVNVTNNGSILGTGDQRNGTFYADSTAEDYNLTNNGRIDAGRGNNGSGVSLQTGNETGDVVGANIENNGRITGRGDAVEGNTVGDGVRLFSDEQDATFKGDIVNNRGGVIEGARRNDAAVGLSVEDGVKVDGTIRNDGVIRGADTAIDAAQAGGDLNIVNNGRIKGDIKLGAGNDTLDSSSGRIRGDIDAGAGDDTIVLGRGRNTVTTGEGRDTIALGSRSGRDTVTDFNTAKDTIDVSGAGVQSFDDLNIRQRGDSVIVRTGAGSSLVLQNTRAADLNANNFVFAGQPQAAH